MAKKENVNKYFSHDSNARNSEKLIRLRMKEGAEGYGIYFMLLERLREEPGYSSERDYNMLSFDLRVDASLIKTVVEDYELFTITEDGKQFYSSGFKKRMEFMDSKKKIFSEAGKRGMATRWNNHVKDRLSENDNEVITTLSENDNHLITTLSENDNKQTITYNNKQNNNTKENSTNVESKKGELSLSHPSSCSIDFKAFLDYFNNRFNGKLPAIRTMNDARKKAVKARAAEYGKKSVFDVLEKVANSSFLLGHNDRDWICDFNWIFKPSNFVKILEGSYDNKSANTDSAKGRKESVKNLRELAVAVLQGNATKVD